MRIIGVIVLGLAALAAPAMAEINTGLSGKGSGNGAASQASGNQGKVVDLIPGSGRYSYLKVKSGDREIWIAGVKVDAKKGDQVRYKTSVVMHDFRSKELKRTFDEIIFAESIDVVQ